MVNIWISPDQATQYESLDPSNSTATSFPEGALIAKEQLDEGLQPFSATVMYKGPAGYNPEANDWWFATVDLRDREFIETGPDLPSCASCHSDAAATDFIFGLPHESEP